ncbi:hypothetical membrane protein [Thermococcus kodakarensis KOD1]|uniref:Hypothetical membrane protein n=1 Tax=Thermococcus kodakarensis (strain ATCC BAA-918 / JCM 12380 / KOD1) TaxID=69014 RepID=Q5JFQ8_THEKO|nr:hypothetical protein [Thermococcus kodakarensis]WCN28310.1 hypothetical protein POG15_01125 [Thermococcus kodakarensis]WCN30605.1 hypothetical protein POG21_01125 [Thermococcus kodakarensis]BAD84409.1 hypothetical membrane protein [Thermococcus kodakarensis KOD1]
MIKIGVKPVLLVAYSFFVFLVEASLGIHRKVADLYLTTQRVGGIPCVKFYCVTSTWILALAILIAPLLLGYLLLERYEALREHAKSHLLFGLLLVPVGLCKTLYAGGFVTMLYFLSLATDLSYLLQQDYYEKRLHELALVVFTWFLTTSALMLKPWVC